jgi:hypothetical protein
LTPRSDHLKPLALKHHRDEILPDIVMIALDGADDEGPGRFCAGSDQMGPQDLQAGVHGPRGDQDMGDIDVPALESCPHDVHPGK